MNKNTLRNLATTTLAAALLAAPAIALAPTATADTEPVTAVTLPATIDGPITAVTLPHQLTEAELAGIVTLPADLTEAEQAGAVTLPHQLTEAELAGIASLPATLTEAELAGAVTLPATIDRSAVPSPTQMSGVIQARDAAGNVIAVTPPAQPAPGRPAPARGTGGPVGVMTLPATIGEPGTIGPLPVVVDDLDPSLGIVAISADISDELFIPISFEDEGTIELRDEDGNLVGLLDSEFDRTGLGRTLYDNVTPVDVDDIDPALGIVAVSTAIEPISGVAAPAGLSPASITGISAGFAALVAGVSYLSVRKSRARS